MKRFSLVAVFLILALAAAAPAPAQDNSQAEAQAVQAAMDWLALVDAGEWEASWDQASEFFKSVVVKSEWVQMVSGVRSSMGAVFSRQVQSAQYATSLPGAPDGEYVVIEFATSFANKAQAVETVTPMRDPDGSWRVSGYYIN